jgi:hypothetical protein
MLVDKELDWMSQNATEIKATQERAAEEVKVYIRARDGAKATVKGIRCIELSIPDPDRNNPNWDYLPRTGCRVSVLKDNGFERQVELN